MCMEDIKIGRTINAEMREFTLPLTTPTLILPAAINRVAVTFVAGANAVTFLPQGFTATAAKGINLTNAMLPLTLRIEDIGNLINQPWFASASAAGVVIYVISSELSVSKSTDLR